MSRRNKFINYLCCLLDEPNIFFVPNPKAKILLVNVITFISNSVVFLRGMLKFAIKLLYDDSAICFILNPLSILVMASWLLPECPRWAGFKESYYSRVLCLYLKVSLSFLIYSSSSLVVASFVALSKAFI